MGAEWKGPDLFDSIQQSRYRQNASTYRSGHYNSNYPSTYIPHLFNRTRIQPYVDYGGVLVNSAVPPRYRARWQPRDNDAEYLYADRCVVSVSKTVHDRAAVSAGADHDGDRDGDDYDEDHDEDHDDDGKDYYRYSYDHYYDDGYKHQL